MIGARMLATISAMNSVEGERVQFVHEVCYRTVAPVYTKCRVRQDRKRILKWYNCGKNVHREGFLSIPKTRIKWVQLW